MRASIITSAFAVAATTVVFAITPVSEGNPDGAVYRAQIDYYDQTGVDGWFKVKSAESGKGVALSFEFRGIAMSRGGPFAYEVHEKPVSDRDCNTAGGIFDPYGTGSANCKEGKGELCEVGNVSGRFRPIDVSSNENSNGFLDDYMSTDPKNKAFIGDKSIVIQAANGTRVACANFQDAKPTGGATPVAPSNGTYNSTTGANSTNTPTTPNNSSSSRPAEFTSGGQRLVVGFSAILMAAVTIFL